MKNKVTSSGSRRGKNSNVKSETKKALQSDLSRMKAAKNVSLLGINFQSGISGLNIEKNSLTGSAKESVCRKTNNGRKKAELGKSEAAGIRNSIKGKQMPLSSNCMELNRGLPDSFDSEATQFYMPEFHDTRSINLLPNSATKKRQQPGFMKTRTSFWVLNDDIIRAVQQKLRTSEKQATLPQHPNNAQPNRTMHENFPGADEHLRESETVNPTARGEVSHMDSCSENQDQSDDDRDASARCSDAIEETFDHCSSFQPFSANQKKVDLVLDGFDSQSVAVTFNRRSDYSEDAGCVEINSNPLPPTFDERAAVVGTLEKNEFNGEHVAVHTDTASEITTSSCAGQEIVSVSDMNISAIFQPNISEISEVASGFEKIVAEIEAHLVEVPEIVPEVSSVKTTDRTDLEMESQESTIEAERPGIGCELPESTTILEKANTLELCSGNQQEEDETDMEELALVQQNDVSTQRNSSGNVEVIGAKFEDQIVVSSGLSLCVQNTSYHSQMFFEDISSSSETMENEDSDFHSNIFLSLAAETNVVRENAEAEEPMGEHDLPNPRHVLEAHSFETVKPQDCGAVNVSNFENVVHEKAELAVPNKSPTKILNQNSIEEDCFSTVNKKSNLDPGKTIGVTEKITLLGRNIVGEKKDKTDEIAPMQPVASPVKKHRRRRHGTKFTRKKMRKSLTLQPQLAKSRQVESNCVSSWVFERPITDQVISGRASYGGDAEISPDVENAASVLAMMRGRPFVSLNNIAVSNEKQPEQPEEVKSSASLHAGLHMCDVCGHTEEEIESLKKHMTSHCDKSDFNIEPLILDEIVSNVTELDNTDEISDKPADKSQYPSLLHRELNIPKLIINLRAGKVSKSSLASFKFENDVVKSWRAQQKSIKISRKVPSESVEEIANRTVVSDALHEVGESLPESVDCQQISVSLEHNEKISENSAFTENQNESSVEKDNEVASTSGGCKALEPEAVSENVNNLGGDSGVLDKPSEVNNGSESDFQLPEDVGISNEHGRISLPSDSATDASSQASETDKVADETSALNSNSSTCTICNHLFSSPANMRKHIRMKHNLYRPHKCPTCGKGFPYPSSLQEHMTIHSAVPKRMQICHMCGKDFVRASGLRKHVKEHHEGARPYVCHICDKGCLYLSALKEHLRSHSEDRTFKCKQCDSEFKHASNMLTHIKKAHRKRCCRDENCSCSSKTPAASLVFKCAVCGKEFVGKRQLKLHMRKHGNIAHLICKICNAEFPNKFLLTKHRLKHPEIQSFDCEVCQRSFLSNQSLQLHLNAHAGIKPYQCEHCGKQYSTKNSLKNHSAKHSESSPYACGSCNKQFVIKEDFANHSCNRRKDPLVVCCFCNERFKTNGELRRHILTHDEQKTFVCSFCSKRFLHESNLRMHIIKHTGEKPHSCAVCGRCFSLKTNLNRHVQLHQRKNGHIIAESATPIPGAYVILGPH